MVQFIDLGKKENFASNLGNALGQGLSAGTQFGLQENYKNMRAAEAAKRSSSALQSVIQSTPKGDTSALMQAIIAHPSIDIEQKKMMADYIGKQEQLARDEKLFSGLGLEQSLNPQAPPSQEASPNTPQSIPGQESIPNTQPQVANKPAPATSVRRQPSTTEAQIIAALKAKRPDIAKELRAKRDAEQKQIDKEEERDLARAKHERDIFESDRERETKRATPILEENDQFRKLLQAQRLNIKLIKEAAPEATTQDYLADLLNYEPLRTAKGSQLKTAAKDLLLKNIQAIGRQPNQWIEQQIDSAMAKLGKSPEANLTIGTIQEAMLDMDDERSKNINALADQDRENFGYEKGSTLLKRAEEKSAPFYVQREKQLAYDLRRLYEKEDPKRIESLEKVRTGTPLTLERAQWLDSKFGDLAEQVALDLGYTIPDRNIHKEQ